MSLFGLEILLRQRKQEIKAALHDAATTLEIDPHDEVESDYEYSLVFDSRREADKVADLALMSAINMKRSIVTADKSNWLVTLAD
jgi:hypothetical protein